MSKPVQMTLRLSPELWSLMQQVMGKSTYKSVNEFIRTCIRAYIDETGDIIGSRKHFQKSLQMRLDQLEAAMSFHLNILLYLIIVFIGAAVGHLIGRFILRRHKTDHLD